mmetsp:Transcript_115093/g.325215  ORF Transcript_115093/g.325215 Transcript_115093/m.325215 type:complete len:264 (-) Transcript_115093:401-1192(-)
MPAPRSHCSAPHRSASATCPRPSLVARSQRRPVWRQRGQRPAGPPRPSSCWNRRGSTGSSPLCTSCVPREMGDPAQPRGRWPSRKRFPWRSETPPSARRQARASRPDSSAWCRCGCTPTRRSPSGLPARLSRPAPRDPWPRDPATCPARCPASPPARSRSLWEPGRCRRLTSPIGPRTDPRTPFRSRQRQPKCVPIRRRRRAGGVPPTPPGNALLRRSLPTSLVSSPRPASCQPSGTSSHAWRSRRGPSDGEGARCKRTRGGL